jgi:hypothetical protein
MWAAFIITSCWKIVSGYHSFVPWTKEQSLEVELLDAWQSLKKPASVAQENAPNGTFRV